MQRHEIDLVSLVAGLLFAGLSVAYLVGAYTDLRLDPRYVLPLVIIGLGVTGLAASVVAQRRSDRAVETAEDAGRPSDA